MDISRMMANVIVYNYPENILVDAEENEKNKWLPAIYRLKNDESHMVLVTSSVTEDFDGFDTKEKAIKWMEDVILELAMKLEEEK